MDLVTLLLSVAVGAVLYVVLSAAFRKTQPAPAEGSSQQKDHVPAPASSSAPAPASAPAPEAAAKKAKRPPKKPRKVVPVPADAAEFSGPNVVVAYGTQSGTAKQLAEDFAATLDEFRYFKVKVKDLEKLDPDNLPYSDYVLFLVVATYTDGRPPPSASFFDWWLTSEAESERSWGMLTKMKFGVFGLGNSLYKKNYNRVGRTWDGYLHRLGAQRVVRRGEGDESEDLFASFEKWKRASIAMLQKSGELPSRALKGKNAAADPEEQSKDAAADPEELDSDDDGAPIIDLEDLTPVDGSGKKKKKAEKGKKSDGAQGSEEVGDPEEEEEDGSGSEIENEEEHRRDKDMISSGQRKILTKQGYKVVGGHSAVKMCRWTKSMLRGRGGCYKHTFYGIASHLCMEATPSLACANKCMFCWRHHKNPVGREWRWKMDDPELIVEEGIKNHVQMIKAMKGVPGVKQERFREAFTPKHCALSLVGEPIIYPEINKFLDILHSKDISSFLVTNAQFPAEMKTLRPITQMYISVDAATPEALKEVDRPLFEDFWERFLACIDILREKEQRTVFRMTLIKEYNMEDMPEYVKLIQRGRPSFVEVKGVTYCGGTKPQIGMKNVPWHEEVVQFCKALEDALGGEYGVASEHEHSCCVLLARKEYHIDGAWHTWIDYAKFQELVRGGQPFTYADYMAPTPYWATFGAEERGFDPEEFRMKARKAYTGGGC